MRAPLALSLALLGITAVAQERPVPPPQPYGPLPSARQLAWHELEFYGFVHFTTNTFTDREWGYGDESPSVFAPSEFDADQIARVAAAAGMRGLILTCKHHDGMCLWDSAHTEHDVASSPYRGDVVGELSAACARRGLRFGVYLSPWDRNHPEYGRQAYVDYFRAQLRELLTRYGPIFEVWFDGANGGDGFYGGARENRLIDRGTYYGWPETVALVRELQPLACVFGDAGGDVRWVGNERGEAGDPCWATYSPRPRDGETVAAPGTTRYWEGYHGHRDGERWMPAEVDVSIRPGWFYHADQDDRVRTPESLLDLYFGSVGRGAALLLNVPPDRRGQVHPRDEAALRGFASLAAATFAVDLAAGARLVASAVRGGDPRFGPQRMRDGDRATYWATADGETTAEVVLELPERRVFNIVDLREHLPLGQRIDAWAIDTWQGEWRPWLAGRAIGNRRLARGPFVETDRVRLRIIDAAACPAISEVALYAEPARVRVEGARAFTGTAAVELVADAPGAAIHYTLDGSPPGADSPRYEAPIALGRSCVLRAVALLGGEASPRVTEQAFTRFAAADLLRPVDPGRALAPGIEVLRYEGGWQTLDQMAEREPVSRGHCAGFDLAQRTRDEHAALAFTGFVAVPADDVYEFFTVSDDGSRLYVGDRRVVDNDGLHGAVERSGVVGLAAGTHPIRVEWFNAAGDRSLTVDWAGPGFARRPLQPALRR